MRKRLIVALLLGTTALAGPAQAGPLLLFAKGFGAAFGTAGFAGGAVATALGGAASFGFTVGSALGGTFLGRLALSVGLSAISARLQRPRLPDAGDQLGNFAQDITPMPFVFGRARVGGAYGLSTFQTDRRHYTVILASHRIDAVESFWVDERAVVTDAASGEVETHPYTWNGGWTAAGQSYVSLRPHLGAPGQAVDATLDAQVPGWTSAHDMAGLAYVACFARKPAADRVSELYGNSPPHGPSVTALVRGALVYDPRTETTAWSDNAALVFAWMVTQVYGGTVNWARVAIEADVADETVTDRYGVTRARWRLGGSFDATHDFATLIDAFVLSCNGHVAELPDGTIDFTVGRFVEPTITLGPDDLLSIAVTTGQPEPGAATEFTARYTEPLMNWRTHPSGVWIADPDAAVPVRQDVTLPWVNDHFQAIRCLVALAVANSAPKVRLAIGAIGYELLAGARFVRITAHGWDDVLEIGRITPSADFAGVFEIDGHFTTAADFAVTAEQEPERPPRGDLVDDDTVAAPASVSGTAVNGPGIRWTWAAQPEGLTQELRLFTAAGSEVLATLEIRDGLTSVITSGLVDGAAYRAELRNLTTTQRPSLWAVSGSVTAVANATPPGPVTGLAVLVTGSDADLSWTTANDPAHAAVRIYRADYAPAYAGAFDIGDAALVTTIYGPPNTAQGWQDASLSAGVYAWWGRSINSSGIEATAAGPVSEEI